MHKMTTSLCTVFALLLSYAAITLSSSLSSPEEIAQENLRKLAVANNALSIKLLQQLTANSSENIFFSPLSLSTAFGMLYYGTRGKTAEELRIALGYDTADLQEELVHQTFHRYLTENLPNQNSSYVLRSANAVLFDKILNPLPSFKNDVQDLYQASVKDVDFIAEGPQIVDEINSWVREKTNGKIESLIEELDPLTVFILLNAVYFNGPWKYPFEERSTRLATFYNNGLESEEKIVPMMNIVRHFSYKEYSDLQVLELPYKGENMSMLILLPNERDGLESLEKNLTSDRLSEIRRQMSRRKLRVTIPKFKIEYSKEMSEDFKSIGAKNVFTSSANISGITSKQNVFLDKVYHKATVDVNEKGSEASAATALVFVTRSRGGSFKADHPFLFAIVDNRIDMVLFFGRVTNL